MGLGVFGFCAGGLDSQRLHSSSFLGGLHLGFDKVVPKRNDYGAYGYLTLFRAFFVMVVFSKPLKK